MLICAMLHKLSGIINCKGDIELSNSDVLKCTNGLAIYNKTIHQDPILDGEFVVA